MTAILGIKSDILQFRTATFVGCYVQSLLCGQQHSSVQDKMMKAAYLLIIATFFTLFEAMFLMRVWTTPFVAKGVDVVMFLMLKETIVTIFWTAIIMWIVATFTMMF